MTRRDAQYSTELASDILTAGHAQLEEDESSSCVKLRRLANPLRKEGVLLVPTCL